MMISKQTVCRALGIVLFFARFCFAQEELRLPSIFSDHMILQRNMCVPVWGAAGAGTEVTVEFAGQKKSAVAGADGKWSVALDPMEASSESRILTVSAGCPSGAVSQQFSDVLVGEVWFCSGQSNMYRPVGGIPGLADSRVEGADAVLSLPEEPRLRLFCDDEHPLWKGTRWQCANAQTLELFSATAYFFGRKLLVELDVPAGLVLVSRGGTMIQAWTPEKYARQAPVTAKYMDLYEQSKPIVQAYNQAFKEYRESRKNRDAKTEQPAPLSSEIDTARTFANIGGLYERLIAPQVPFAVRGVIWYQGESNASREATARHYDEMLRTLIRSWRAAWNRPDMPFYFVQLPVWAKESEYWPWIRQSMLQVVLSEPDTGMAVILDAGDPDNLHPAKKQPVGERLARLALAKTYGKPVSASAPLPASASSEKGGVWVRLKNSGTLLRNSGGLTDIEMAGEDGVFYPAEGTVSGPDIFVTCTRVKAPQVIRYGWKGGFIPSLFDTESLPVSPFCFIRDGGDSWRLCSGHDCF